LARITSVDDAMSTVRVELNTASTGTSSAISTIRSAASAHDIYTADVTRLLNTSIGQAMNQAIEATKMHVFLRCGSEMMLVMTRAHWHTCTTTTRHANLTTRRWLCSSEGFRGPSGSTNSIKAGT